MIECDPFYFFFSAYTLSDADNVQLGRYGRPEKTKEEHDVGQEEDINMTAINDREREEIQAEVLARWLQHRETGQGGFSRETSVGIDIGSEGPFPYLPTTLRR